MVGEVVRGDGDGCGVFVVCIDFYLECYAYRRVVYICGRGKGASIVYIVSTHPTYRDICYNDL